LDETSKQLIAEMRVPISMKAGRPARFDYEYERNGTANLFMMFAPLEGATRHGHRSPYRRGLRSRLERLGRHPLRARQDHRSGPGQSQHPQQGFTLRSLPAVEARRLVERFEWHYTPKTHGTPRPPWPISLVA